MWWVQCTICRKQTPAQAAERVLEINEKAGKEESGRWKGILYFLMMFTAYRYWWGVWSCCELPSCMHCCRTHVPFALAGLSCLSCNRQHTCVVCAVQRKTKKSISEKMCEAKLWLWWIYRGKSFLLMCLLWAHSTSTWCACVCLFKCSKSFFISMIMVFRTARSSLKQYENPMKYTA